MTLEDNDRPFSRSLTSMTSGLTVVVVVVDVANAVDGWVATLLRRGPQRPDEIPITSELKIVLPEEDVPRGTWPVFRMMVRARRPLRFRRRLLVILT